MGRWLVESSLRHGSGNLGPHACLPHKDTQLSARKSAVIMCAKSQSHSVTNGLGTGTSWSTCIGQCLWLKCTMTYGNSALEPRRMWRQSEVWMFLSVSAPYENWSCLRVNSIALSSAFYRRLGWYSFTAVTWHNFLRKEIGKTYYFTKPFQ